MGNKLGEKKWLIAVAGCLSAFLILRQFWYAMVYTGEYTYSDNVLLLGNAGLIQLLQAMLAILVCVFAGKFISLAAGYEKRVCIIVMLALYGLIGNSVLENSVFQFPVGTINMGALLLFFIVIYTVIKCIQKKERSFLEEDRRWFRILILVAGGVLLFFFAPEGAAEGCLGENQYILTVIVTLIAGYASYLYFHKDFLLELFFLFAAFFSMDAFWEIPNGIVKVVRILWILTYLFIICVYFYKRKYNSIVFLLFAGCLQWISREDTVKLSEYCFGVTFALCCVTAVCILDINAMLSEKTGEQRWKKLGIRSSCLLFVLFIVMALWMGRRERVNYSVVEGQWYGDGWLGESIEFVLVSRKKSSITLQLTNAAQIEDMDIICSINGEEMVYHLSVSEPDSIEVAVPWGKSTMKLTASKTFKPESGDQRQLSVLLKVMNDK